MMKQESILIGCYAVLNLIGGTIGYFLANSLISLLSSVIISSILLASIPFIYKGNSKAYSIATAIVCGLTLFFSYRFFLTYKLAPSGIMSIISGVLSIYLIKQKQFCLKLCNKSKS